MRCETKFNSLLMVKVISFLSLCDFIASVITKSKILKNCMQNEDCQYLTLNFNKIFSLSK